MNINKLSVNELMLRNKDNIFLDTIIKEKAQRLEDENKRLRETLKNIENDDFQIPATIWEMRNKALGKVKEE
ncbi:unnamed protein product [marine sediment metagenome]|uniref:Uncharacterized protein n=1 Tax=marine sediment metagenome TaxID=412755 RepID=X0VDJ6_9ZZZZ